MKLGSSTSSASKPGTASGAGREEKFHKLVTQLNGIERMIEVSGGESDLFQVRSSTEGGGERTAQSSTIQWTSLGHGRHLFAFDGRAHVARIHRTRSGEYIIEMGGRQRIVRANDEVSARAARAPDNSREASGPVEILAPMPGTVIQVMVSDGDPVVRGQTLFTIEAMKMQNEISAPIAGVVAEVSVEPGQAVESRFRFCRIDP